MKASEWISVDDKLPDIGERVLVYIPRSDNHYNIEIAYISEGKDDYPYWVLREKSQFYSTRFHYISHWASFPESPKNDDTKDACTRHLCGLCDKFNILRADGE